MKKILPAIVSLSLFCPICDVCAFPPVQGESKDDQNIICEDPKHNSKIGLPMDASGNNMTETPTNSETSRTSPPQKDQQKLNTKIKQLVTSAVERHMATMNLYAELLSPPDLRPIFPDISFHWIIDELESMAVRLYRVASLWGKYQHLGSSPQERMNRLLGLISDRLRLHESSDLHAQLNWKELIEQSRLTLLHFSTNEDPGTMKSSVCTCLEDLIGLVEDREDTIKDRYHVTPLIRTLRYVQEIVQKSNLNA